MNEQNSCLRTKGFTLVELLVVITIIAILSVIGMTIFSGVQKGARDAKRRLDLNAIAKALEIYKTQHNTYTPQVGFPCASDGGFEFAFNAWNFGIASVRDTCDASLYSAWKDLFASGIPQDPKCKAKVCDGEPPDHADTDVHTDYFLSVPSGGASFTVSAHLETGPSVTGPGCKEYPGYPNYYNYCVKSQQ